MRLCVLLVRTGVPIHLLLEGESSALHQMLLVVEDQVVALRRRNRRIRTIFSLEFAERVDARDHAVLLLFVRLKGL